MYRTGVEFGYRYMPNIVRDFWMEFHKTTIGSQCHKHNNTDLLQLIVQVTISYLISVSF